jgi:succinate dehydrogenase/fumarate reductase flavoprotein subunit
MLYDVLIIGGGVAGLMSAIELKEKDSKLKIAIVTKGNIFKSNSSLASGGINAVLKSNKNYENEVKKHINDTLKGSYGLGNKRAVSFMCKQASDTVYKLHDYGVDFAKNSDETIAQRPFGGGSSKRTCFVGDKTGSAITQTLIKKARDLKIEFLVNTFVMNITQYKNRVSGIIALNRMDSTIVVYPAKAVIFASGGYAGIYRGFTTNAQDYTGDLLAIALRSGLRLKDMEFVQFHPTGFVKTSYLVSEAARGEGGYLVNSDGERFVDELTTRDVVARAITEQIKNKKEVFIDLRHLPKEQIEEKLPSLLKSAYFQAGVDITSELLPIKPVAHYTMGGIETEKNRFTNTAIKGLFVCGEIASSGVHGANRLGGNSLLEGAVFGELAGKTAFEFIQNKEFLPIDYNIVAKDIKLIEKIFDGETTKNFNAMRISLGRTMFENVGIYRDEVSLNKAFDYLRYLRREANTLHTISKTKNNNVELISILELRNALEVSEAIVLGALERRESRGSHHRVDFPEKNKKMNKSVLIKELKRDFFKTEFEKTEIISKINKYILNN